MPFLLKIYTTIFLSYTINTLRNRYNSEKYYACIVYNSKYYSNFVHRNFQQTHNTYENISLHQSCS